MKLLQKRSYPHTLIAVFALLIFTSSLALAQEFGAYYTKLNSGGQFEKTARVGDYADILVRIDAEREFIFWRASSYLPHLKPSSRRQYVE